MLFIILPKMGLYNTAGKTNHFILSLAFFSIYLLPFGSCYNGFNANNKEVQILVDGIDNFCRLKVFEADRTGDAFFLFSGLSFEPSFLDFGEQPFSHPKHVEVTITNIDADQSIDLVTTFGVSQFIFWSRFNQTALSPASSANFNITFLPYTVGDFETSIYIQTSLGVAKYQVFGSSYISDDYLIPLVNLESLDENKKSFELKLVNPLSCSVKVDNLRVFSDGLLTEYCSYSQVTSNSTSRNDLIDNYAFEPIILHSYEKRSLLKATIDADDMELIQISSLLWEFDPYCKPDQIFSGNSTDGMGFLSSTNKFSKLPAASISINKFINQVLYSRVSLLYLGVINSRSGSISKPIEVLFLGNQLLEITSIEANIYDEALSIDITEKIISPHTTTPKTIAIVTLSSAHLSHSYYLSGIITVFTNDQSIYLRIPFYGRLVYGSLTSSVQTVPNYLNEKNQQDPVFLFRFMLTNRYDFTLFISKIDFLTPSHKYLLQLPEIVSGNNIHHHITNAELIPNQTKLFMSISIVDNRITRLHGIMVVYSSISTFHIPYDIYSGKLHFFIDGARQLQDVYLLGTTLIGQIRNQSITIVNLNPVPVELTSVNIYTESDNNAKCEIMKHKHEGCQLSGPCEKCLFQFTEIQSLSEVNIPFSWGNENVAQHIKGFIQIKTKYTVIEQQFEYFVTRGLINVIPNPLIVNSLFPGKIIMHKITVQNAYPTEINITDIKLHRAIMSSDNFDNEISFDIQFYKIKRNKTSNDTNSPYLFQPIQFSANQSRVIGVVYFDPSASCVDRFEDIAQCDTMSTTATVTTTTTSTTNTTNSTAVYPVPYIVKPLGANKPFCYCGFNLDTSLGMLWLKGVRGTVNQSTEKITHQSFINRLIIEETFKLYNELYNQWLKHLMNKDITSKHPFMNKNILTSISYKLPDENVTFFSDLSVRYMWPQITRARKVPINVSSKHLTFCTIKNVPSSLSVSSESENRSLLTHRLMQIPTVTSSSLLSLSEATNSFECIFQITNPQSTINPLFVQPLLWNEVYKIYATNESELNHLKKLITNISADSTFIDSLFTTQYGEFSIQPFLCSDCQLINHSINLTYPPSYILPSNGSGQYFRLIFTPYQNIFELLNQNKVNNEDNIRSLLIIRNNLTSIEPLWLEIHFGRIGLTLGKLSTTKTISKLTKSISAFVSKFENDPSHIKHSISPNIDLYIRNVPPSSSSSGSSSSSSSSSINGFSTLKDNLISSLKIDQTLYDIDLDFTSLFNNKAIHQKIHQDLSLKFEFTEKTIGTFCEPPKTKSIDNLPSPFQSKHRKQSSDSNHFADIDNHQGLLTTLSLRRRLVLLNTGQVTLSIFMLSLLPSMNGRQKFTENFSLTNNLSIPTSYSWLYSHLSCNLNGFKLDPCILPPTTMTTAKMMSINDPDKNNSSNIITILPGQQIIIELRHYPDFTHTFLTANLIIQLYPTLFQSNILQWWDLQQSNKTDDSHILLIDLPKISLQAIFNANLLGSCLSLLPRPSIESFLSMTVFLFYLLNITAILIISYGDAKEIYTRHIKLRHYIDELPENVLSDSSRRFNLNQPSDKLCINCCINDKNLCNPSNRELFTTSNSQLSYSTITTSNTAILMKKQLTNSIIENDEISTLNSTTTGTKLKWKDKINSDEQKLKYEILTTRLDWINYYFQWLLGLLFLIKYISLHWILIIIKYPYKTMKRYIICLGKCKDWLISSLNLINYGYFHCIRQSSSDVINATNDNSQSTPSSNDTMIINKKNLFGLSKQSSADEVKNQKASLKSYSRNLSKLTNQTSDKASTSRVNRKKKTMVPLVEISKPSGFNANASDDHANVSNRSRFTKIESVSPLPPAATPTTPTQAVNKDASPPRMAEADIVAAVQASIRLTEDVNSNHHHHEIRRKQAQRISSRKKCYNSSSPSSASGPDVDDDNNKSKLDRVMNVFYQNDNSPAHLNCKSDSIDKISSSSSADNQRVVNHQNKKETSKSTVPRLPHTKQLIDEYNEFIAEECVTSQELLETANHKSISSSLIPSSELDKSIKYPHQSLDTVSNSELFDWPETIQTCPNQIARMHHYVTNDQYPLTIYPLWSGAVTELATYWDQTLLHSDEMLYSSDSPDEAMNRLSEETHTFAQSFMTEPTDPSSFHSQFISSQFETTHFIQPTGIYENGLKDYFSQDKFILNNNIYSGIWNTMKENDNNQSYLSTENSPEYLSSDHLVGQGFLQSDHFCDYHINKITVENAFNTTLPIIYSLIQCNDDRKNSSTALQSSSINFPTNTDELDRIDTPLITQIFLDALRTAHRQIVDEINPSYHYTNSIVNSSSENTTPDYYTNDDDNNTMRIDCNPHDSCRTSFCELSRITESRRLSVLNYEAEMNSSIEEKMEIKEEYFDLVPNPLKNGVSNDQISSEELCGYSSWKCIVDIPQSELFQELGLSETTSEQSNFVSTGFMNYENIFNESSAIAPWTYIFEKVIRRINGVDNNQDSSLNCENKLNKPSSSLSFSTTITLTDMIE